MPPPNRILLPDHLELDLLDFRRRLLALETNMGRPMNLISSINSATQNQNVPAGGNFPGGGAKSDLAMDLACTFRLLGPTTIIWFSYATLALSAPGGGFFAYLVTSVSLAPWDPAAWIYESGSQIFDKANTGYLQSEHHFVIAGVQTQGGVGPGGAALGISTGNQILLPAGTYEVRQRMFGDAGTRAALYQANIEVFTTGG